MEPAVLAFIAIIVGTAVYSAWGKALYSLMATVASIACYIVMLYVMHTSNPWFDLEVAFAPADLFSAHRTYTLLTSMFAHGGFWHLFLNVLGLVLIGMVFEQRIGTRPFMVLYFAAGVAGTLAFAAVNWGSSVSYVLGASGAISGVLGGFARLYPNERMSLFIMFIPLPPMPIWAVVGVFVLLQLTLIPGSSGIAWEAHLGGLAAGIALAPLVARLPLQGRPRRTVSMSALRRLAVTPELRSILRSIEYEEVPDVRSAWVEHFLAKARCPYCGARLRPHRDGLVCERGHLI